MAEHRIVVEVSAIDPEAFGRLLRRQGDFSLARRIEQQIARAARAETVQGQDSSSSDMGSETKVEPYGVGVALTTVGRRTTPAPSPRAPRIYSKRTGAEDSIAHVLSTFDEPTTALLYDQLRKRGWSEDRARTVLKKADWLL